MSQTQTEKPIKKVWTSEQILTRELALLSIREVMCPHRDGTIGFCVFDTNRNLVHVWHKLNEDKNGVQEIYPDKREE